MRVNSVTVRAAIFMVLAVGLPLPAQAGIFQWTDSKGTIHFTDDYERVPSSLKGSDRLIVRSDLPSNDNAPVVREEEPNPEAAKAQDAAPEQQESPAPPAVVLYDIGDIEVAVNSFGGLRAGKRCLAGARCAPRVRFDFNDRRHIHPSVFDNASRGASGRHRSFFRGPRSSAPKVRSK
jgi:hypothetical protein